MSRPSAHKLDIYDAWLHLATDKRAWNTLRRKMPNIDRPVPTSLGQVTFVEHTSAAGRHRQHLVLWINVAAVEDLRDLVDTIAHEATHAGASLLDELGQQQGNSEALAYLVGWITGWIWAELDPATLPES